MSKPTLIFVGGFLGAGKTTLILKAAELLQAEGQRVAVILNDQSEEGADTPLVRASGADTAEIGGGCFCCRFDDLIDKADALLRLNPQVIFAEPVGSCADISATVIQPLKALHSETFHLAPLTVLLDPARLHEIDTMDEDVQYLIRKQLEEADLLCASKADEQNQPLPPNYDFALSGRTGVGVSEWLGSVLRGQRAVGERLLDIDYKRYAQAEAVLGWLNWHGALRFPEPVLPSLVVGRLLDDLEQRLTREGTKIAHLKLADSAGGLVLKASITANGQEPSVSGQLLGTPSREHDLYLNLRAAGEPARLRAIVETALGRTQARVAQPFLFEAFRPQPPVPQHRYTSIA